MNDYEIIWLNVTDLKPYEKNAKKHDKAQVERIANSIKEFGFRQNLVIDENNTVIIGHGRLEAAKLLGMESVPCVKVSDLTEEQIKALRLADNKVAESEWDFDFLAAELEEITELDMEQFGFNLEEPEEAEPVETVQDEVPEEIESRVKAGDLWQLGEHRLICGDSTSVDTIEKLVGGGGSRPGIYGPALRHEEGIRGSLKR